MKGFVPTPPNLVDKMVAKLFAAGAPREDDRVLDPGCGTGAFIEGILRWCANNRTVVPHIVGVESDRSLLAVAEEKVGGNAHITLKCQDFLTSNEGDFDYIVGNPPYVPITGLTEEERAAYRKLYRTAQGRFDLYLLFFERSLSLLRPTGRLVFVTPEKFLYVQTAAELRRQLRQFWVREIDLIDEASFADLVTYPTITLVQRGTALGNTDIRFRDGSTRSVRLDNGHSSWLPTINGVSGATDGTALSELFRRISCGVATGADSVFVVDDDEIPAELDQFAFRTLSGRQIKLGERIETSQSMLIPYSRDGLLLSECDIGPFNDFLREPSRLSRLMKRTCVRRKPWYAFHETPPLSEILRPKILCKDIGSRPWFVVDEEGDIVPRHSVYYLVPNEPSRIHELCDYLNSAEAVNWLTSHCQRAANGYVRMQSHVLKQMPVAGYLMSHGLATV